MARNEQGRFFALPGDGDPASPYPLSDMRAHPGLPARTGQRRADQALPADASGGDERGGRGDRAVTANEAVCVPGHTPDWAIGRLVRHAGGMAETLTMMAVH